MSWYTSLYKNKGTVQREIKSMALTGDPFWSHLRTNRSSAWGLIHQDGVRLWNWARLTENADWISRPKKKGLPPSEQNNGPWHEHTRKPDFVFVCVGVALGCLVSEWRWLPEPYKRTNRDKIEHNLLVTSRTLYDDARPVFCTSQMKRFWRILYMNGLVFNCAQIPGPPGDGEGWPRKKNNWAKCSAVFWYVATLFAGIFRYLDLGDTPEFKCLFVFNGWIGLFADNEENWNAKTT